MWCSLFIYGHYSDLIQSKLEKSQTFVPMIFYSLVEKRQKIHAMVEMVNVSGKGTCADAL